MKTKLLGLLLLVSAMVSAGGYEHSFGVTLGMMNGLSYKGYVSSNVHFVMQVDAYWQMGLTTDWRVTTIYTQGTYSSFNQQININRMSGGEYQSAVIEPSFMYQGKIGRYNLGNMYWFAGGGVGFGMLWGGNFNDISWWCQPDKDFRPWYKMSQHLMMGVEFSFNGAPLVMGIELRPGMAQNYVSSKGDLYDGRKSASSLIFDWGANFSLRYCIGEEKVKLQDKRK